MRARKSLLVAILGIGSTCFAQQPTWTQQCPPASPPGRYAHMLAYDAARQQVVMFGGANANTAFNDTWVWDGTNWTQKFPITSPPATSSAAIAYDAARQQVVMFGGAVGGSIVADAWVWDGVTWTQKFPAMSPAPRLHAAMAYDAAHQQIVLFGGGPGSPTAFADTWSWDGTNWTQRFPATSPPARSGHRMAYDALRGETVLFGGTVDAVTTFFNDTWVWDGTTWTQKFPTTSPTTPRFHFGFAYDAAQQSAVLFGGQGPNNTPLYNDTWAWDGTTWAQQVPATSPPGHTLPAMAYDEARSQIVLFGGFTGTSFANDTWVWGAPVSTTCLVPPVTHTLTVASTNPSSGVPIAVSPADNNALTNGTTLFARTYNDGTPVTLTAPLTTSGNNFSNWTGCDPSPVAANCTVTMTIDRAVAANYVTPPPPALPDLTITSVKPVQVVYGADLVLGKNTAFAIVVHVDNSSALPVSPISVTVNFEGIVYSATLAKTDFHPAATGGSEAIVYLDPMPRISPTSTGPHTIIATVNPGCIIPESNCSNNDNNSIVPVVKTKALSVTYVPIPQCTRPLIGCYGPLSEQPPVSTVDESNRFIQATYPISETGFAGTLAQGQYLGSPLALAFGVVEDITKIGTWAALTNRNSKSVAVGIVPANYFDYHGYPGVTGMQFFGLGQGALAVEGFWTAPAHEIGHIVGKLYLPNPQQPLPQAAEEYSLNPPLGDPAAGFWVDGGKSVGFSTCFMGLSEFREPLESLRRWVDDEDYAQLLQKLSVNTADPEVLLLTALLHKDGTVDLRPWYDLPDGQVTGSLPGGYTVRTLNGAGETLTELSLPVSFTVQAEPFGVQPTDVVPLVITVPYPPTAATVKILHQGQVLTSVSPISKTLADAIEAIPDFGFVQNPSQLRNALRNKVMAIAQMLNVGANQGAYQALLNDLRPSIQSWLVDTYTKTAPDQLEKKEILFVIDGALERISNL